MHTAKNGLHVEVKGLTKSYGKTPALRGLSFSVPKGGVFAYLGPNGAGKTTTIKILSSLMPPDSGRVRICGLDVAKEAVRVKELIGVVPDESNLYPELTCSRNLDYLGQLYGLGKAARKKRVAGLLERFGLKDRAGMPFRALSRGLKRRLVVAAALIHSPEVLFLDEPTIGLDVPSAKSLRSLIKEINAKGTTIFLTTHNLAEAEALADTVCILINGGVVEIGRPAEIQARVEKETILKLGVNGGLAKEEIISSCPAVNRARQEGGAWLLHVSDLHVALAQFLALAERKKLNIDSVNMDQPSLEDAFLTYVENGAQKENHTS